MTQQFSKTLWINPLCKDIFNVQNVTGFNFGSLYFNNSYQSIQHLELIKQQTGFGLANWCCLETIHCCSKY